MYTLYTHGVCDTTYVPTDLGHSLQYGLPEYLIQFAPHTFALKHLYGRRRREIIFHHLLKWRHYGQFIVFTFDIPLEITAFDRFLKNSMNLSITLDTWMHTTVQSLHPKMSGVSVGTIKVLCTRLRAFNAQSCWKSLALHVLPRLLAHDWSVLFGISFIIEILPLPFTEEPSVPACELIGSCFRTLTTIPHCCHTHMFGSFSSPTWMIMLSHHLPIFALVRSFTPPTS